MGGGSSGDNTSININAMCGGVVSAVLSSKSVAIVLVGYAIPLPTTRCKSLRSCCMVADGG